MIATSRTDRRLFPEPDRHSFPKPDSHSFWDLSHSSRFSNKKILNETKNEPEAESQCLHRFLLLLPSLQNAQLGFPLFLTFYFSVFYLPYASLLPRPSAFSPEKYVVLRMSNRS